MESLARQFKSYGAYHNSSFLIPHFIGFPVELGVRSEELGVVVSLARQFKSCGAYHNSSFLTPHSSLYLLSSRNAMGRVCSTTMVAS